MRRAIVLHTPAREMFRKPFSNHRHGGLPNKGWRVLSASLFAGVATVVGQALIAPCPNGAVFGKGYQQLW